MWSVVLASALSVSGFVHERGLFLEQPELDPKPNNLSLWIMTDDAAATCKRVNSEWARRATEQGGISISDYFGDRVYFLAQSGEYYARTQGGDQWTLVGSGAWLAAESAALTWTERGWQSDDLVFLGDPRPEYAGRWYQLGPAKRCHVFQEKTRRRGPFDVLTVELGSGVPGVSGWALSNGYATIDGLEITGNWLP